MNKKENRIKQIAKDIIADNIYLTLATGGEKPWAAPLYYCVDDKYNFYYISSPDSLHSRHVKKNPHVAFAIFNSQAKEGQGNGIQGSGKAYLLDKKPQILKALKWYKTSFVVCKPSNFISPAHYRLYKIVPQKFFVLDPETKVDTRIEAKFKK